MWLMMSQTVYTVGLALLNVIAPYGSPNPIVQRLAAIPLPAVGSMMTAVSVMGLFIDLPVFFVCLGGLFAWRLIWGLVRVYRIILELVPMMG